jgi:hypothetical protein
MPSKSKHRTIETIFSTAFKETFIPADRGGLAAYDRIHH